NALIIKIIDYFFFSSRRRHTSCYRDWSSDVCSSDLDLLSRVSVQSLRAGERRNARQQVAFTFRILQRERRISFEPGNFRYDTLRSEERRVGKECRARWARYDDENNVQKNNTPGGIGE